MRRISLFSSVCQRRERSLVTSELRQLVPVVLSLASPHLLVTTLGQFGRIFAVAPNIICEARVHVLWCTLPGNIKIQGPS